MKGDAWEGGHRVPFLARWPGRIEPRSISHQTISFVDMMATFAAIVGDTLPEGAGQDSVDILPALLGKAKGPLRKATIFKQNATASRVGKWKLITHLGSGGFSKPGNVKPDKDGPKGQLYNLEGDLGETNNLWSREPEIVDRLSKMLDELKKGNKGFGHSGRGRVPWSLIGRGPSGSLHSFCCGIPKPWVPWPSFGCHGHACVAMRPVPRGLQHAHASVGMAPDFPQQKPHSLIVGPRLTFSKTTPPSRAGLSGNWRESLA